MQRHSKKREAILELLKSVKNHPTAEWIYSELKPSFPDLSLATVYRNLANFIENGDVISVGIINSHEHFDGDTSPHAHFICDKCGKITDIESYGPEPDLDDISSRYEIGSIRYELVYRGICSKCV